MQEEFTFFCIFSFALSALPPKKENCNILCFGMQYKYIFVFGSILRFF